MSLAGATRSIAPSFSPDTFTTGDLDVVASARARANHDGITLGISFSAAIHDLRGESPRYAARPAPTLSGLGDISLAGGDTAPVTHVITIGDDATAAGTDPPPGDTVVTCTGADRPDRAADATTAPGDGHPGPDAGRVTAPVAAAPA